MSMMNSQAYANLKTTTSHLKNSTQATLAKPQTSKQLVPMACNSTLCMFTFIRCGDDGYC